MLVTKKAESVTKIFGLQHQFLAKYFLYLETGLYKSFESWILEKKYLRPFFDKLGISWNDQNH